MNFERMQDQPSVSSAVQKRVSNKKHPVLSREEVRYKTLQNMKTIGVSRRNYGVERSYAIVKKCIAARNVLQKTHKRKRDNM